ncbi:MAG: single-stranded-DNA-specific exonuclease RecJ [Armatimonadota bacterium]
MIKDPDIQYIIGKRDPAAESALAAELRISPLLAAALRARGIVSAVDAAAHLNPSLDSLGDPELLPDFNAAADVLLAARERKDLVYIHGDYDTDGVTSAAHFDRFLRSAGWNVHTHVPHRIREGYGVNRSAVEEAKELGAKVFLTCDCGIAAFDSLEYAHELGMTVVVTDHHEPQAIRPRAAALVNPMLEHSQYPFRHLVGVGVVFRFCEGLAKRLGMPVESYRRRFLEFACVGTVADVAAMVGENRTIVSHGLTLLPKSPTLGFQQLALKAGLREWSHQSIAHQIGPRLNAAGRINEPGLALRALLSRDIDEVDEVSRVLEENNTERQKLQRDAERKATEIVMAQGLAEKMIIIVVVPDLLPGLAGLVAGTLCRKFERPAVVLHDHAGTGHLAGSARSVPEINFAHLIEANRHLGLGGGGHAGAAGINLSAENLPTISEALEAAVIAQLPEGRFIPSVAADFEASLDEFDLRSVEEVGRMEPCGRANEALTVLIRSAPVVYATRTNNPTSVRWSFRSDRGHTISAIQHQVDENIQLPLPGATVDLIAKPTINEWNGNRSPQFTLEKVLQPPAP